MPSMDEVEPFVTSTPSTTRGIAERYYGRKATGVEVTHMSKPLAGLAGTRRIERRRTERSVHFVWWKP